MHFKQTQLTHSAYGHTIHNTQVFSKDDQWIVYDTRNGETSIGENGKIEMVNTTTGKIQTLYITENQTKDGPGVASATFSPMQDSVLFIHGIRNADKERPYSFTRRTGVAIDINKPNQPVFMDARDIDKPFTKGALRGGTHAHTWSGDGRWISFTYNDYIMEQLAKQDTSFHDLRTVGVMVPRPVRVNNPAESEEDNSGKMFSVVVAKVVDHPKCGSDEVNKAYDETWIGKNGYINKERNRQEKAIAFQGNVKDSLGETKTEVFVIDLPADLTIARPGKPLEGTDSTRPNVPAGVEQRRITYTKNGIEGPRFWLRTTMDGSQVFFLSKDANGIIQIYSVSPNGGEIRKVTHQEFSVQGSFNVSPDDKYIAYIADNSVFITDLKTGESTRLTPRSSNKEKPVGAPVWSNIGNKIAYNRYVKYKSGYFLQIYLLNTNVV